MQYMYQELYLMQYCILFRLNVNFKGNKMIYYLFFVLKFVIDIRKKFKNEIMNKEN